LLDEVGAVTREESDSFEAVLPGQFDLVFQQRFAADGNHWLGQITQARAQPLAHSAGHYDRLSH
jgi:hypothetical protein